jgi:hypothetical protein
VEGIDGTCGRAENRHPAGPQVAPEAVRLLAREDDRDHRLRGISDQLDQLLRPRDPVGPAATRKGVDDRSDRRIVDERLGDRERSGASLHALGGDVDRVAHDLTLGEGRQLGCDQPLGLRAEVGERIADLVGPVGGHGGRSAGTGHDGEAVGGRQLAEDRRRGHGD